MCAGNGFFFLKAQMLLWLGLGQTQESWDLRKVVRLGKAVGGLGKQAALVLLPLISRATGFAPDRDHPSLWLCGDGRKVCGSEKKKQPCF